MERYKNDKNQWFRDLQKILMYPVINKKTGKTGKTGETGKFEPQVFGPSDQFLAIVKKIYVPISVSVLKN